MKVGTKHFGILDVVDFHEDKLKAHKIGDQLAIYTRNMGCDEGLHLFTKIAEGVYENKFIGYTGDTSNSWKDEMECNYYEDNDSLYGWVAEIRALNLDFVVELTPQLRAEFDNI